jgi:hypothetical protein
MAFRPIMRDDTEEVWRLQIHSLLNQIPTSPMELFQLLHRLIKVLNIFNTLYINGCLQQTPNYLTVLSKTILLPLFCRMLCFFTKMVSLSCLLMLKMSCWAVIALHIQTG